MGEREGGARGRGREGEMEGRRGRWRVGGGDGG